MFVLLVTHAIHDQLKKLMLETSSEVEVPWGHEWTSRSGVWRADGKRGLATLIFALIGADKKRQKTAAS